MTSPPSTVNSALNALTLIREGIFLTEPSPKLAMKELVLSVTKLLSGYSKSTVQSSGFVQGTASSGNTSTNKEETGTATVLKRSRTKRSILSKRFCMVRGSAQRREENYAANFRFIRSSCSRSAFSIFLTSGGFIFFFFFSDCFGLYRAFLDLLR